MSLSMLKKAMISYVTNVGKAIWSEIAHPLTIKGKKSGNLISYRMYGNSTQSGTPTPSDPKEIKSVGELVTEGENVGQYKISVKVSSVGKEKIVDIYLDEPLRMVGEYNDEIDFEKGQVTRRIYREKITDIASKSSTSGTYYMYLSDLSKRPMVAEGVAYCIASKFKTGALKYSEIPWNKYTIKTYRTSGGVDRVAYSLTSNNLTNARAEIGDGFDVCYVLYTAITENIELPPLPQFNGTTTYEVITDTPPSGVEVCYYG